MTSSVNITSNEKREAQAQAYRDSCTHYRKGHVVHSTADDSVVFTGTQIIAIKDGKNVTGPAVNQAKDYVRKNNLRSYTVR